MNKKPNYIKAVIFAVATFILMSLFWRFLGNLIGQQIGYMAWAWNMARKLSIWGFAITAFIGGLK